MSETKKSRLIPAFKWCEYHEWPPQGGLRHLIHNSEKNGFDKVIKRVGKTVLIDEDQFFIWVNEQDEKSKIKK